MSIKWNKKARSAAIRKAVPKKVNVFLVKNTANGWRATGQVAPDRNIFFRATGELTIHVAIKPPFVAMVYETGIYDFHVHDKQGNFLMALGANLCGVAGSEVQLR